MFRRRAEIEQEAPVERGDIRAIMVSLMRIEASLGRIHRILEEEDDDGEAEEEDS